MHSAISRGRMAVMKVLPPRKVGVSFCLRDNTKIASRALAMAVNR